MWGLPHMGVMVTYSHREFLFKLLKRHTVVGCEGCQSSTSQNIERHVNKQFHSKCTDAIHTVSVSEFLISHHNWFISANERQKFIWFTIFRLGGGTDSDFCLCEHELWSKLFVFYLSSWPLFSIPINAHASCWLISLVPSFPLYISVHTFWFLTYSLCYYVLVPLKRRYINKWMHYSDNKLITVWEINL